MLQVLREILSQGNRVKGEAHTHGCEHVLTNTNVPHIHTYTLIHHILTHIKMHVDIHITQIYYAHIHTEYSHLETNIHKYITHTNVLHTHINTCIHTQTYHTHSHRTYTSHHIHADNIHTHATHTNTHIPTTHTAHTQHT